MDSAERMNDTLNEQVEKLDEIKEKQLTRSEMEELAEMTAEKIIEKRMRA